jgi:hypothetical protein
MFNLFKKDNSTKINPATAYILAMMSVSRIDGKISEREFESIEKLKYTNEEAYNEAVELDSASAVSGETIKERVEFIFSALNHEQRFTLFIHIAHFVAIQNKGKLDESIDDRELGFIGVCLNKLDKKYQTSASDALDVIKMAYNFSLFGLE